jgi:signal peptidase I
MGNRSRRSRKPAAPRVDMHRGQASLRKVRDGALGLLPVLAIFLGTRVALAEAYRIPSGSMEPTLQVGDWLFVNKLKYGPHIPFTHRALPGYAAPSRNDVVVFVSPSQNPAIRISPNDSTPTLVKRIAGVAGDTLLMRRGQLFVNGLLASRRNDAFVLPDSIADQPMALFDWQHALEAQGTRFGAPVTAPSTHEWGPIVVPNGTYFMIGDNRDDSVDSRYYGPVTRDRIRGTPMFVYYSYDPAADGIDFFRAITAIRWQRLGTRIR